MAIYVPASRRRARTIAIAAVALVVGVAIGAMAGRGSVTTVDDRVRSVRAEARQTAAALRVIALHDQSGAASQAQGEGGAAFALRQTKHDLDAALQRAPWLSRAQRDALRAGLAALTARTDRGSPAFGAAADALADQIDQTFASR